MCKSDIFISISILTITPNPFSAQFLLEHGHHDTDSIMRGKAAVAFHNGNFKELYSIMEGRYRDSYVFSAWTNWT